MSWPALSIVEAEERGVHTYPESVERICAHFKATLVDPVEKVPEKASTRLLSSDINFHNLHRPLAWLGIIIEENGGDAILHDCLA
jgi:hypothetical protein